MEGRLGKSNQRGRRKLSRMWCLQSRVKERFRGKEQPSVPDATEGSAQMRTENSPLISQHGSYWTSLIGMYSTVRWRREAVYRLSFPLEGRREAGWWLEREVGSTEDNF